MFWNNLNVNVNLSIGVRVVYNLVKYVLKCNSFM
jgi:hypothetical protein